MYLKFSRLLYHFKKALAMLPLSGLEIRAFKAFFRLLRLFFVLISAIYSYQFSIFISISNDNLAKHFFSLLLTVYRFIALKQRSLMNVSTFLPRGFSIQWFIWRVNLFWILFTFRFLKALSRRDLYLTLLLRAYWCRACRIFCLRSFSV